MFARFEVRKPNGDPLIFGRSRYRSEDEACRRADAVGGHVLSLEDGWSIVYQSRADQRWYAKHGESAA